MMNITNITQLVFCVMFFITCKVINKTPTKANLPKKEYTYSCELCDFWINVEEAHLPKEKYLINTRPSVLEMVKWNDEIEEYNNSNSEIEAVLPVGPWRMYTQSGWNRATAMRFCFIGKTKNEIKDIFAHVDSLDIVSTKNGLHFFSIIGYKNADCDSDKITSLLQLCSTFSQGRYLQFINFSADSTFLGNHRDSIFLNQCINRDKNR